MGILDFIFDVLDISSIFPWTEKRKRIKHILDNPPDLLETVDNSLSFARGDTHKAKWNFVNRLDAEPKLLELVMDSATEQLATSLFAQPRGSDEILAVLDTLPKRLRKKIDRTTSRPNAKYALLHCIERDDEFKQLLLECEMDRLLHQQLESYSGN